MLRGFSITSRARLDLEDAERRFFEYAGPTPQALLRFRQLVSAIYDLEFTAATWPKSPDHPGYRERIVVGCKIFYDVKPEINSNADHGDVTVYHVRLPGQDEPTRL